MLDRTHPCAGEYVWPDLTMATEGRFTGRRVVNMWARNGGSIAEVHLTDGLFDRYDGPAIRIYREDGTVAEERYYHSGTEHRDGGPAWAYFDRSGRSTGEGEWFRHGARHRLDGPAKRMKQVSTNSSRGRSRTSVQEEWWADGKQYPSRAAMFGGLIASGRNLRAALAETEFSEFLLDDPAPNPAVVVSALADGVTTVAGIRAVLDGSPIEWVRSFEAGQAT